MQNFLIRMNQILFFLFFILYAYQFFYLFTALLRRPKKFPDAPKQTRYCVLIAARNEEKVIRNLIDSIHDQTYPSQWIDICVVADNCTDRTAQIAREAGAYVVERNDLTLIGKGYALDYLLKNFPCPRTPDAYLVFDADNILDPHYIEEMNKLYAAGYPAATSYRNSCNYDSNWISAGYALWFLRESRYLNQARMQLGTSCAISGTGFMVSRSLIEQNNGWIHHLLTEDVEFSVDSVLHGITIGYCDKAIVYDEQPTTFRQSWNQRLRWCKGFYQVLGRYGKGLIGSTIFKHSFAAYDMTMAIAPAALISIATLFINGAAFLWGVLTGSTALISLSAANLFDSISGYYRVLFVLGLITVITEWNQIRTGAGKKLFYCFTFPLFMFTYVPIAVAALRKNVCWSPIAHTGYPLQKQYRQQKAAPKMPVS